MWKKGKKPLLSNNAIMCINIGAACLLFFGCCFFFFSNLNLFWQDITSWWAPFPIFYFAGVILVCFYICSLVSKLESKQFSHADRYDLPYRIVFTVTLLLLIARCSINYLVSDTRDTIIIVLVPAILSGLITWFTPKIKDNNNPDF